MVSLQKWETPSQERALFTEEEKKFQENLLDAGAEIIPEKFDKNKIRVRFIFSQETSLGGMDFREKDVEVTVGVLFHDPIGSDIIITNITVFPETVRGGGNGARALDILLTSAKNAGFVEVRATQCQEETEGFWLKNGFVLDSNHVETADFIHRKAN